MSADINETCSCGATIHINMASAIDAKVESAAWRKNHRHEFPPTATLELKDEPERHDTTLDAYVERPSAFDRDKDAEMDRRTDRTTPGANPIGYRP
jgi:hypothetical protein